jgi:hypothetical protein
MMKTSLAPSPPLPPFGEEAEPFAPGEPVLEIVWFCAAAGTATVERAIRPPIAVDVRRARTVLLVARLCISVIPILFITVSVEGAGS